MLPLSLLKAPLMAAAGAAKKQPIVPPSPTAPKPMLTGMFGKAGRMFSALPDGSPDTAPPMTLAPVDPLATRMPMPRPMEEPRVEDVPIPALPGRTGGSRPYDPQIKHEYDYVMSKAPRDADGNERKMTFGERFKSSALPALLGMVGGINSPSGQHNPLGGAIGGAIAGAAGGMLDPVSARQFEWSQMYKPELDQQEAHRGQEAKDKREADESLVNLDARRAGIDYTKAQTEAMKTNNQANAAYKQSQILLNAARAKALETGKPQVRDIVDELGQVRTYSVYPDGTMMELGGSAKAALNTENNTTRRTIADNRNTTQVTIADKRGANALAVAELKDRGQTGRTAMTQAGQNQHAAGKVGAPASPSKPASNRSRQAWIEKAVNNGFTRAEAEAYADQKGLK